MVQLYLFLVYILFLTSYSLLLLLAQLEVIPPPQLRRSKSMWALPLTSLCLSLIIVGTSSSHNVDHVDACSEDLAINPDIGGIGVLLGLFVPSMALMVVLVLGHWTSEPFAAKELCLAHMASTNCPPNLRFLRRSSVCSSANVTQICSIYPSTPQSPLPLHSIPQKHLLPTLASTPWRRQYPWPFRTRLYSLPGTYYT
jgi:hypothetical protein